MTHCGLLYTYILLDVDLTPTSCPYCTPADLPTLFVERKDVRKPPWFKGALETP
jgi:hypothetical protein